jgi:Taurine catabolism dioxygenase TauD, TfdA family
MLSISQIHPWEDAEAGILWPQRVTSGSVFERSRRRFLGVWEPSGPDNHRAGFGPEQTAFHWQYHWQDGNWSREMPMKLEFLSVKWTRCLRDTAAGAARPRRSVVGAPQQCLRYGATYPNATARQAQRYETVFKSTVYETGHPVVQVHPLTGERAIILGYFVRKLLGVSSADSGHLFAMLREHVTRLENMVRWRWSTGDVVIWDNRATQHKAFDDYGYEPRIVRRVTIDGPLSVDIDARYGKTRNGSAEAAAAA